MVDKRSCKMGHTHLNYLKRCHILAFWKAGFTRSQIAREIGVHKSTITREFTRNIVFARHQHSGCWSYKPNYAQSYADARRQAKRHYYKFTEEVKEFVMEKLLDDWSPQQISGYAKRWKLFSISHERIYQFILEDKKKGGELYKHLRHKNIKYRKRFGGTQRSSIRNRRMIDERPKIVDEKSRIGDWEIDTIIGKNQKQAILSIVERVSKFTVLKKLERRTSEITKIAMVEALAAYKNHVHTITSDNGCEFAKHDEISLELNADFFFAHPYSSWERGLNENTNGLVRQYIKKGSQLFDITDQSLAIIADKLNDRPRKTLGFKTPREVFHK